MSFLNQLENIFISEEQIPEKHRLASPINQREFLSNGEMISWNGPVHEVYSPICIRTQSGLQRKLIGSYPVCTEVEAMEALGAAVKAYDNGRGEWPTMSVAERIVCIENFTHKSLPPKHIVLKMSMRR